MSSADYLPDIDEVLKEESEGRKLDNNEQTSSPVVSQIPGNVNDNKEEKS